VADRRTALAMLLALPALARAAEPELERLFAGLAALGQRRARFVERRYSALTRTPLESRGELLFKPPATLERVTLFPQREVIRIEGEQVTVRTAAAGETGEQTIERRFRLDSVPRLAQLAEALRATLAGDLAGLQRVFRVTLSLPPPRWRLQLEPFDESTAATLRLVNVSGRDTSIERFEMLEAGGDRTELQIAPL